MSSFLSNYCFIRCPARPASRNSLIQDDNNTTDDSDIYGDLGECSIKSEYSNSMISTLISQSSTELENFDLYKKEEHDILENLDRSVHVNLSVVSHKLLISSQIRSRVVSDIEVSRHNTFVNVVHYFLDIALIVLALLYEALCFFNHFKVFFCHLIFYVV